MNVTYSVPTYVWFSLHSSQIFYLTSTQIKIYIPDFISLLEYLENFSKRHVL